MMRQYSPVYNDWVTGVIGRGAALALFASLCFLGLAGVARADETYAVGPSPIVRVLLSGGKLVVQQWDNPQVSIASTGILDIRHIDPGAPGTQYPAGIPIAPQSAQAVQGTIALVRENFVLPQLPPGRHDAIVIRGQGDTVISVPRGTALVFAHDRDGHITIQNFRGTFVAHSRTGSIDLQHVSGTGFVQTLTGTITSDSSSFTRLRARTGTGDMLFRGCTSNQIEASSTYGSIVYDNGQFAPGLARFESQYGNVGLGVQNQSGGVQIGAHSGSGRVMSNYSDGTQVTGSPGDTEALVRGGGPVVTTSSQNGSVYLYNGSMAAHPAVQQNLQQTNGVFPALRPVIASPRNAPPPSYPGSAAAAGARVQPARAQYPRAVAAPVPVRAQQYPHGAPVRTQPEQPHPRRYQQQSQTQSPPPRRHPQQQPPRPF
jgi:Putative adhesin